MSAFQALGISVVAGLLALSFVWLSHILWRWVFENVYLKITCRHLTDISGRWKSEYTDKFGHSCYDETELKQYGHKIEGVTRYRIDYTDGKTVIHKEFKLRGLLRNDIFSAYFWNVDRKQKGTGAFSLAMSQQGDVMKGKFAWFDVEANEMDAGDWEWYRVD